MSQQPSTQSGRFQIDAKLTETYRLANPVGGLMIAPLRDNAGILHVFSLGSDNHLYDIYQDPASDAGWSMMDMQFTGSGNILTFAAGVGSDGVTMVFAADSTGTLYSIRDQRWAGWHQFSVLVDVTPDNMKVCHDINGNLLCTIATFDSNTVWLYWTDYTQQNANNPIGNVEDGSGNRYVNQISDYQVGLDASSGVPTGLSTWLVGMCRQDPDPILCPVRKDDAVGADDGQLLGLRRGRRVHSAVACGGSDQPAKLVRLHHQGIRQRPLSD